MLIVDTRANVPLVPANMDWNPDNIQTPGELVAIIPVVDDAVKKAVKGLAYEIAVNQFGEWPDLDRITVALVADISKYSFGQYSLLVGAKPYVYDNFSVMLTEEEARAVQAKLFDVLGMY